MEIGSIILQIVNMPIPQLLVVGVVVVFLKRNGVDVFGAVFGRKGADKAEEKGNAILGELELIRTNHFHEMKEGSEQMVKSLERIERKLDKLDEINEGIVHIKAKMNGHAK